LYYSQAIKRNSGMAMQRPRRWVQQLFRSLEFEFQAEGS
jgi:hypothetical protein